MNANLRSFHRMPRNAPAVFSAVISIQQSAIGCEPFAPACRIALIGRIEQWDSLIIYECWCNGASELQRTAKKGGSIPQRKVSVPCSREFLMPLELSEKYFLDSRVLRGSRKINKGWFRSWQGLTSSNWHTSSRRSWKGWSCRCLLLSFLFLLFFFLHFSRLFWFCENFEFAKTIHLRLFHCTDGLIRWTRGKLIKIFS